MTVLQCCLIVCAVLASYMTSAHCQVCVCVEDVEFTDAVYNGRPGQSGKFCGSLRRRLMREHLGLLMNPDDSIDITDITCDDFYFKTWLNTAITNTDIYEEVFRCLPTDQVLSFDELAPYTKVQPLAKLHPNRANELLAKIRGFLVMFPTKFLSLSDLSPSVASKEGIMPIKLFV